MIAFKREIYLDDPEKLELTFSNLPFKKGQKLEILIFAEEDEAQTKPLNIAEFNFKQSREILKELNSSLAEEVVNERREI